MYFQITERCNMNCAHCGMNSTSKGMDMSFDIYKKVLEEYKPEYITLGGGEPTIHPQFLDFLLYGMSYGNIWLATNGTNKKIMKLLTRLAKRGIISVALSQDDYHDPIDSDILEDFMEGMVYNNKTQIYQTPNALEDLREIRNVSGKEINSGRCDFGKEGCICPDTFIKPNGDIHVCGCEDSPKLGNINNGYVDIPFTDCYKEAINYDYIFEE